MQEGWIKVHRQISESEIWTAEKFSKGQAWIDLLLLANHKPQTIFIRGIEIRLERGELAYSQLTLAKRWRWNRKTVMSYLSWLENREMIHTKNNNVTTLITIKNYVGYQGERTPERTPEGHQNGQQKDTKTDTDKNDKNENNENNEALAERFIQFWKAYPKKLSKGQAEKVWNRIKPSEQLLATMIARIEQAKTSEQWRKEKGQFIPHPATWLNAKGWEDEHGDTETEDDYRRIYRDAFGAGEGV